MIIDDVGDRKIVSEPYLVVVHVMRRSDFQASGTESHLHITVLDDRNFLVYQRDEDLPAFQPMIPFVFRIYTYGGIGHDSLRTCSGDDDVFVSRIPVSVRNEISQMIELADCVLVNHFLIADCSVTYRVPVHHPDTSVYIAFPVEIYESVYDSLA